MGKIAFIYPGQGAQKIGMGKDFYETKPNAKRIFDEADKVLDFDIKNMLEKRVGVILGDLHDGLVLTLGALEHLILALVGIGGHKKNLKSYCCFCRIKDAYSRARIY